jgi:hypothetical protein
MVMSQEIAFLWLDGFGMLSLHALPIMGLAKLCWHIVLWTTPESPTSHAPCTERPDAQCTQSIEARHLQCS